MGRLDPQSWLFCQMFTIVYAPKTITEAPASRPSAPSARLAPLDVAVTMNQITSRTTTRGSLIPQSWVVEKYCDAGRTPRSSAKSWVAKNPNPSATTVCPAILARLLSPWLCWV